MPVYPVACARVGVAVAILDCFAREFHISMMPAFENKLSDRQSCFGGPRAVTWAWSLVGESGGKVSVEEKLVFRITRYPTI